MTPVKLVLIDFLKTMIEDLKRRAFDETGEQREETLGRVDTLKKLINELEEN